MIADRLRRFPQKRADLFIGGEPHWADLRLVESETEAAHSVDLEPLRNTWLIPDQTSNVSAQGVR
jgi:hypothetical protein